ncbi:phytoene desaturase family protein [Alkalihalophilus pseudofirmus]|uniref:4,4'-diaponeurosporene oxygenase n=1 Tax=Alkalihalophilus pseudofirmus TaxID=79885 RepID=A0AAJ2KSP5_ALKPS|nr:phytoene desaturase family protein [Alkalihalophilus pseudofirmus]MDV2884156.1 phytoene desaturase family protein [Alkalihalophilus pseudofirmus]
MKKKVVGIVGGGLGGLASAVLLAYHGFEVHLVEKNQHLGGKMMRHQLGRAQFDFGPNTITMPDVFKSIFKETGVNPDDYLEFIQLKTHTRNHFTNGTTLDLSTDVSEVSSQLTSFEPDARSCYSNYLTEIKRLYGLSERYFFHRTFTSWTDYLSPELARALTQVRPHQTLDSFHRKYFTNEQVIQMFNRYATYIGSSPYVAPATFAMIAYLELIEGVYYVKGGNPVIAEALTRRAVELGVNIKTDTEVNHLEVKDSRVTAMALSTDEMIDVDEVIMNGDLLSVYPSLVKEKYRPSFKDRKRDSYEPSISALVLLVSLNKRLDSLIHHQVYFSESYEKEFNELFTKKQLPRDPTVYICNSSYTDPAVSPDGDNLFILVNAPAITNEKDPLDLETYKEVIYDKLEAFGVEIRPYILEEKIIEPNWIASTFNAYRGALYGPASNKRKDAYLRPANKAKDLSNLYFVGGSTHPGGGSPMVTLSGKNIAKVLIDKHG